MKTAFKRVALVAAAALAIGGISAVSAQATGVDLTVTTASQIGVTAGSAPYTETATQIAGPANYVTVTEATSNTYVTVTGGTFVGGTTSTVTTSSSQTLNVATPAVGTITVNSYPITSGVASTTAATTITITVVAALPGTLYASSAVLGASSTTTPSSTTDAAFSVVSTSTAGTTAANFTVTQQDANAVTLTTGWKAVNISTTAGSLTTGTGSIAGNGTNYLSGTPSGVVAFNLVSNGQVGTATVNVSVNGVSVKSYSVLFSGAAAKIVLTAINPVVAVGVPATLLAATNSISANTNAFEVQEFDAAGNAVGVNTGITLTSGSTSIATAVSPSVTVGTGAVNYLGGTTSGT